LMMHFQRIDMGQGNLLRHPQLPQTKSMT